MITETITALAGALERRETTSEALLDRCLQRIAERNPAINAFITVCEASARAQARQADSEIAAGRYRGALHGIPISLKDLFDLRGTPTTAASNVRRHHVATQDAAAVSRLRDAGAVFVGKTNLHEFAFGTTNEDSAFGPARHPVDPSRSPGGSSGGSGASVADGMCCASMGTDTGGSIRIPSALCGLVGLKPTVGELSTAGVVPLSATMDHIGPMCRSVDDARIMYDVLRGASSPREGSPSREARGLTFAIPRGYFFAMLDPQVAAAFDRSCERLREAGVALRDVEIPHTGDVGPIYLHLVLPEAAAYHAKTLERQADQYTPNVRLRLEMGRYVLAEDYARAMRGRALIRREVDAALEGTDGLLMPSMAIAAPKIGTATMRIGGVEEPIRNLMLRCTQLFNVSGHPAITLPNGRTSEGLPTGAQIVGHFGGTPRLLDVAKTVETYLGPGTPGRGVTG